MKNLIIFFLSICFATFNSNAQFNSNYTSLVDDSVTLLKVKNIIKQQYLKDSLSITGENKKYTLNLYRDRFKFINRLFSSNQLIVNQSIDNYLKKITTEIITKNPLLKNSNVQFLFSRAYWPNAFSTGEGTIVFNIGLFSKLENESQVAFVLCHELAHLYLDHSNKAIHKYISAVYSDEFQSQLKEIKKQKYEQNKELDKLEKGIAFSDRRHSRLHESEADSIAIVFLNNTGFDINESIACLGILDKIDKDTYNAAEGLSTLFNFSEYPFQNRWIKKEAAFFGISTDKKIIDKDEDSLKTHPDCKVRMEKLAPFLMKNKTEVIKNSITNKPEFDSLKKIFEFEAIEYCFSSNNVSRSLYQSMELFSKYNNNAYLATMIGKCFNSIYENQKNHTLGKIVSLPNPLGEKNYNTLLEFIQNIRLDNIASISYYFLKERENLFNTNTDYIHLLNKSKHNFNQHK